MLINIILTNIKSDHNQSVYLSMWVFFFLCLSVVSASYNKVPAGGLTLHISVTPSDMNYLSSAHRRIVWPLQQCFTILWVTIDLPHGGKTYAATRGSDPVYLKMNTDVYNTTELKNKATKLVRQSVQMLNAHCFLPVSVVVSVLNHTNITQKKLERFFNFSSPSTTLQTNTSFADTRPDLPLTNRFFVNTLMYVTTLSLSVTKYMLHADIDTTGLYFGPSFFGHSIVHKINYVTEAVQKLQQNTNLVFALPSRTCSSKKSNQYLYTPMSCRLFVSMTTRFKNMLPLRYWASHIEDLIIENMKEHQVESMTLTGTYPCVRSTYLARKLYYV